MIYATGARITVRGEDFLIKETTDNGNNTQIIKAEGISELVKGMTFIFDTSIDQDIAVIQPEETTLLADQSAGSRKTKLYLETQLRNASTYNNAIAIADKAAFNRAQYQFEPTVKALDLPRPRLLIADGVGLGKTIEVGIFMAEMIKRGKGKRILVLALKSILAQFQQEIWNRFAIPLVRLDSRGIDQLRSELPQNKNPFEYYDKTIISIDTLKRNGLFRTYIEKTTWDIIVIDECHTVANASSMRGSLAQLLATRCESLILTSATPHNGKKESFANLIHMIEPTAIPRDGDYTKADIEKYYVRRFKHHIADEAVRANFQDRVVKAIDAPLLPAEEAFLKAQQEIKVAALRSLNIDRQEQLDLLTGEQREVRTAKKDFLFSILLFKSYLSSPQAAYETLSNRIQKLKEKAKQADQAPQMDKADPTTTTGLDSIEDNIEALAHLQGLVKHVIDEQQDAKYNAFVNQLKTQGWKGRKSDERIVVFTERIQTIEYLTRRLSLDFGLTEGNNLQTFQGKLTDAEQQDMIENFGREDSSIRMLITSDAGSQGVNLHYYCHTMFNYDIPWSLITLEQRNGRIDRYGQTHTPYIYYLIAKSEVSGLKTDLHILENLTRKEDEVHQSLGDAGAVMNLYDPREEEKQITNAIIQQDETLSLLDLLSADGIFDDQDDSTAAETTPVAFAERPTLYRHDADYYEGLIQQLAQEKVFKGANAVQFYRQEQLLQVQLTPTLREVLYDLPKRALPKVNDFFALTLDKDTMQRSIAEARTKDGDWPKYHLLYDLHPLVKYYMTLLEASVDKQVAMVTKLNRLPQDRAFFVFHGQVSNKLGQSLISEFFVITTGASYAGVRGKPMPLHEFIAQYQLQENLYGEAIDDSHISQLQDCLLAAIESADMYMENLQQRAALKMEHKAELYAQQVKHWYRQAESQLDLDIPEERRSGFLQRKYNDRTVEIQTINSDSSQYSQDMKVLDKGKPYLRVLAVFFND